MRILKCLMLSLSCWGLFIQVSIAQEKAWKNLGREATSAEVKAWDIDVRGDFKGLPPGRGSVLQGEKIWEDKCAACHGIFGESNEIFPPIAGGTTAQDIKNGRVAALAEGGVAQRTTIMKAARLSTLWDYIHRAMPWDAPKSLSDDEVYAVVAYVLNLGGVVKSDFELSDQNMAATQNLLPNRNGLKTFAGLWDVRGRGDMNLKPCMHDCAGPFEITSFLPIFARNAHGNLAEQNRLIGPVCGANTSQPAPVALPTKALLSAPETVKELVVKNNSKSPSIQELLQARACMGCHQINSKLIGPAFAQIGKRYQGREDGISYLMKKIQQGSRGVWGGVPMPAQSGLSEADVNAIATWLATGTK